jgi:pimeloyl-ACP methyl ester carboxylesterase
MPSEERHVSLGGCRVRYVEQGTGLPVLYVHGNTGSSRWFQRVMELKGCRTVAPDMPNSGRSDPLGGEVSLERYADLLVELIASLGLARGTPGGPVVVGHSLGGAVAIALAARRPHLLRALVLVDSASPAGLVTPEDRYPTIEMMRKNRDVLARALTAIVPTLTDQGFFNALVDDAALMAAPAWIGHARALSAFDYRSRCGAFRGPVLVVWGRRDVPITEAMARETAEAFPGGSLTIMEEVGHSPMVEDPAGFTRVLAGFISGLERERS